MPSQQQNETSVSGTEVAERLKKVFPEKSVAEIARELAVPHATVRNYFNGRLPATEILVRVARKTGVSLSWLLTGRGPQWLQGQTAEEGPQKVSDDTNGQSSLASPDERQKELQTGTPEKVLLAHMELIIQQNNRIIWLLEQMVNK